MIKQTLKYLFEYKTLGREQAREILLNIAKEQFNHSEMVAFLSVYMMRPITVEELSGFMDALRELGTKVDLRGVETIDLLKSPEGQTAEIQHFKEQMAQALIDVVHDFDASWNG